MAYLIALLSMTTINVMEENFLELIKVLVFHQWFRW